MELIHDNNEITPIGMTEWRTQQQFGIKDKDRLAHIYCIGKTGCGKSNFLERMAVSDVENGKGLCFIDGHGDLADHILHYVPPWRIDQVIYFNPAEYPIAFNPLANIPPEQHHLAVSGIISTFKKTWDSWGPRLEHLLRYSLLTLLEHEGGSSLLDIQPLLTNQLYRNNILACIRSNHILTFWHNEYDKYSPAFRNEAIAPILNKMGIFQANAPLRNTVGHKTSSFEMRQLLDEGHILICNLSKGRLGEDSSSILGSLLINSIQLAALARADSEISNRRPFFTYIDECQSYLTPAICQILSESRKYCLGLILANQYLEQLTPEIRAAIIGNVGTLICFRVGGVDASQYLSKEFHPVFTDTDLLSLPKFHIYLKLMIDSVTSKPFSATTLSLKPITNSLKETVIEQSKKKYGRKPIVVNKTEYKEYETVGEEKPPASLF